MFLNETVGKAIPYKALQYLIGECNYGGRVTDDWDRRVLKVILRTFITPDILNDEYRFSESGRYYAPVEGSYDSYVKYIRGLPASTPTEVLGMNSNANVVKENSDTDRLFESILLTLPAAGLGGKGSSPEEVVERVCSDILVRLPTAFDLERARETYPVVYEESMNTVLCQELERFNNLSSVVRTSLQNVQKAIKGLIVMNAQLEDVFTACLNNTTPRQWLANSISYPSLKPLQGYITDLVRRLDFFAAWVKGGRPPVFWFAGFFFSQSFLTGARQNYARKYKIPIDTLDFDFEMLERDADLTRAPEDGVYINGLFLDSARWDYDKMVLAEVSSFSLFPSLSLSYLSFLLLPPLSYLSFPLLPLFPSPPLSYLPSPTPLSLSYLSYLSFPLLSLQCFLRCSA